MHLLSRIAIIREVDYVSEVQAASCQGTGRKLIIAIDGPSGAGKSTLAKLLAQRLGYVNLDTGAMYRSVALTACKRSVDVADAVALEKLALALNIEFVREGGDERVLLDGEDITAAIRTPEISLLTSQISSLPEVRRAMVRLQRQLAGDGGVVLEGRDIGTVVFPAADVKFFLSASARERGMRRFEELKNKGMSIDLEQTIAEVVARDVADSSREHAPLVRANDAIEIDSTNISVDQVLLLMLNVIQAKEAALRKV